MDVADVICLGKGIDMKKRGEIGFGVGGKSGSVVEKQGRWETAGKDGGRGRWRAVGRGGPGEGVCFEGMSKGVFKTVGIDFGERC